MTPTFADDNKLDNIVFAALSSLEISKREIVKPAFTNWFFPGDKYCYFKNSEVVPSSLFVNYFLSDGEPLAKTNPEENNPSNHNWPAHKKISLHDALLLADEVLLNAEQRRNKLVEEEAMIPSIFEEDL